MMKNRGKVLEGYLDMSHQLYRNQKRADISKKEVKTQFDKKTGTMRYTKREGFDFEGCVAGGRSIAIEAKECKKTNLYVDPKGKNGLRLHQLEALLFRGELGGMSAVIWMSSPTEVYLLDYEFLSHFYREIYNKSAKSISLKLAKVSGVQVMRGGMVDYLDTLIGDKVCQTQTP